MRRVQGIRRAAAILGLCVCACSTNDSFSSGEAVPIPTPDGGIFVTGSAGNPFGVGIDRLCPTLNGAAAAPAGGTTAASGGRSGGADGDLQDAGNAGTADAATGGLDSGMMEDPRCPTALPPAAEARSCGGPQSCSYIDGTRCRCQECESGWCWQCDVAELPFGCPRTPPRANDSCAWSGLVCRYGDCVEWDEVVAGCCLGTWRVETTRCARSGER